MDMSSMGPFTGLARSSGSPAVRSLRGNRRIRYTSRQLLRIEVEKAGVGQLLNDVAHIGSSAIQYLGERCSKRTRNLAAIHSGDEVTRVRPGPDAGGRRRRRRLSHG